MPNHTTYKATGGKYERSIMIESDLLFTFGLTAGIVLTIAAEAVILFLFLDWILALVKGKGN